MTSVREDAGERAKKVMPNRREGQDNKDLHQILNANSHYEFHVVRTAPTVFGSMKHRIEVTFDGLPVFGVSIQATYDEENGYTGALTGEFVSGIENDIPDSSACQRSDDFLFSLGKEKFGIPADNQHCRLMKTERIVYFNENNKARLAYIINIEDNSHQKMSLPFLIVDACDLTVYKKFDNLQTMAS